MILSEFKKYLSEPGAEVIIQPVSARFGRCVPGYFKVGEISSSYVKFIRDRDSLEETCTIPWDKFKFPMHTRKRGFTIVASSEKNPYLLEVSLLEGSSFEY